MPAIDSLRSSPSVFVILSTVSTVARTTFPGMTNLTVTSPSPPTEIPGSSALWTNQYGNGMRSSAFPNGIVKIVFWGAKKEMVGIAARRVVTVMEDTQPIWDRTNRENPGPSVRAGLFLRLCGQQEMSIIPAPMGRPLPAPVGDVDLFPESFGDSFRKPLHRVTPMWLVSRGLSAVCWQASMNIAPRSR